MVIEKHTANKATAASPTCSGVSDPAVRPRTLPAREKQKNSISVSANTLKKTAHEVFMVLSPGSWLQADSTVQLIPIEGRRYALWPMDISGLCVLGQFDQQCLGSVYCDAGSMFLIAAIRQPSTPRFRVIAVHISRSLPPAWPFWM